MKLILEEIIIIVFGCGTYNCTYYIIITVGRKNFKMIDCVKLATKNNKVIINK